MNELRNACQWIPGLYIMQGLPFALVAVVAPVLYKDFGFKNTDIAFYTSLLTLPWVFKFLLAPALEQFNKRSLILFVQTAMSILVLLLACSFYLAHWYYPASIIFVVIAIMGAIYDINSDGLYLSALNFREQANLIGIRTVFYQIGRLICRFGLLFIVGFFSAYLAKNITWAGSFAILSIVLFFIMLYQQKKLPSYTKKNYPKNPYQTVLKEFCQLPHLNAAIFFILFYEIPEAQLVKIIPLYMLDKTAQGGLGMSVEAVSIIYGGIGMCSMLIGITLSGYLLNYFSLKKCLIPFSLFSALGYMSYMLLAEHHSFGWIMFCVTLAEFGFGLGNGAYMLYLIRFFSKGTHSMSLYAIGTALMLLGMMIGGSVSGYLQVWLGYHGFFIWIAIISIITVLIAIYNARRILS